MNLGLLKLEGICLLILLGAFVADLCLPKARKHLLAGGILTALALLLVAAFSSAGERGEALGGMYLFDSYALLFKTVFILVAAAVVIMAREFLKSSPVSYGEFFLLILSALLGMMMLASSNDFILLFISLELVTISFYVMTAYIKTDARSSEAGIKYLILGSLSSALLLYGISFLYGTTGSTNFGAIRNALEAQSTPPPIVLLAVVLLIAGLGFKIGSFPFQFWIPDVYQGAPVPVTAFLSVGSKIAGFVVLARIFPSVLSPIPRDWNLLMALLSALTLFYGNLGAIVQQDIKRFLGYSSIGHAGFLLMGMAAGGLAGSEATVFYLLAYGISTVGVFLAVALCSSLLGSDSMEAYDGLSERSPFLAAALFLALLSLAGVPPLAGFFAKFLVLLSAVKQGLLWLAVLGAVNIVISLYYYLVLVKRMYVHPARARTPIRVPRMMRLALYASLAGILLLGVVQDPFVRLARAAVTALF